MSTLVIKPAHHTSQQKGKPWALVIRTQDPVETNYETIALLTDEQAIEVIEAGAPSWLFGEPDWEARSKITARERARQLRKAAEELDKKWELGRTSGANGMKEGDRIIHEPTGRRGLAGEFTQDGDVFVHFDDGSEDVVKWARCRKEEA